MRNVFKRNSETGTKSINNVVIRLLVIAVALAVGVTSSIALLSMNNSIREIAALQADASIDVMKHELDGLGDTLEMGAQTIALDRAVIQEVEAKSTAGILAKISVMAKALNLETVAVTDAKGVVLARSHDPGKFGDDLSYQSNIKKALSGSATSEVETGTTIRYAVKGAAPVFDDGGTVIGAVTVGYKLDNTAFVDGLKTMMGDEFTIFVGDERLNTTIMNNGERAVGTKLDPKIADVVLKQKQPYQGNATIFGVHYITMYSPILSEDGSTATGVLFSGYNMTDVENRLIFNILLIIGIAVALIVINIVISVRILNKKLKVPLAKVVDAAKAIEMGTMDGNIDTELSSITSLDEIGLLARSMEGAVHSVKLIAEDTSVLASAIAARDLTVTVDTTRHNGMYKTIVEIVDRLFSEIGIILEEIKAISDGIAVGSDHIAAAAQTLAQGATEQASSTEELAATISEIAEQIKSNADNANGTSVLTEETGREVLVSSQYMNEMLTSMDEINDTSSQIGKIIKTIDDIAFQTNILALNAAVEAARAGAAGKGFAVVADEVRNLATKSAEAAKSTTVLIESSLTAVAKGGKIAKATEDALKQVVEKTEKVNSIVREIAVATQKQSDGIYQINVGVDQISNVVQTNSATSEETAAASEELAGQAQSLQEMVSQYKLKK